MSLNRSTRFHCHSGWVGIHLASLGRPARVSSVSSAFAMLFLIPTMYSAIYGGWLSDWHSMKLAKKANGIFEPEMRLQLLLIPSIITPVALLMMGLGPYYEAHWIVFVLGLGLINMAGPLGTIIVLNYAFDCYHGMAPTGSDKQAQLINHKSAPYIVASMIIAMSMAFGYVSTMSSMLLDC